MTSSRGLNQGQEDPCVVTGQVVRMYTQNIWVIEFKPVQECCAWPVVALELQGCAWLWVCKHPLCWPLHSQQLWARLPSPVTFICWLFCLTVTQRVRWAGLASLPSPLQDQAGTSKVYVSMADRQASGFMYMEACPDAQPAFVPCHGAYEVNCPRGREKKNIARSGCVCYTAQLWTFSRRLDSSNKAVQKAFS